MLGCKIEAVKMVAVHNTESTVTMDREWNNYFFWELHAQKTVRYPSNIPSEVQQYSGSGYRYWVPNNLPDTRADINEDAWCVITYIRTVFSPYASYMDELNRLQIECERLIREIEKVDSDIARAEEKSLSFFARKKNLAIIEALENKRGELRDQVDALLPRVDTFRKLILQGD